MLNKKKNNKGFTLVELLVVIAIIGILAVVAVPSLFKNIEKGKVAELESDISAIRSAVLSFYAENSRYPQIEEIKEGQTAQIDGTEDKDKILKEVESLGFPFKGTYILSGTEPGKALLTIDLSDEEVEQNKQVGLANSETSPTPTVKLSEDAAKKLVNDLGKVLVVETATGLYTENEEEIDDISEEISDLVDIEKVLGDLDDIEGNVSKIIIELMDGENQ